MASNHVFFKEKGNLCECGKVCFTKRDAQTKVNFLTKRGREKSLRIYPCPYQKPHFPAWHITSFRPDMGKWDKKRKDDEQ